MESSAIKGAAAVAAIAAVFALFFVLRDANNAEEPNPSITPASPGEQERRASERADEARDERPPSDSALVPTITIRDGEPVGGVQELSFHSGTQMRFAVQSDVADKLHLHGYDVSQPIGAGKRVEFDEQADIEGVFELELEERGVPVAEISVTP